MLIRTQNRKTLVKLDNFLAIQITEEKNNAVIKERVAGGWGPLGKYSNCKKSYESAEYDPGILCALQYRACGLDRIYSLPDATGRRNKNMNQSILVVTTPDCCEQCLCLSGISIKNTICRATGKIIKNPFKRAQWCPLKPVEEKK